ncbi:hypothetical protein IT571_08895 [Candidatus Sumerlaeota bacterium]|nr:hypothetical protein [Candidatus Sumerlaeota bacterium]
MNFGDGPEYVLMMVVAFTPNLAGIVLSTFICIFVRGPQGKLRAMRDHFFAGYSLEQIREHLQKRLLADGFKLIKTGNMNTMKAERVTRRPGNSIMTDYPFETTKLLVDVQFQPHAKGLAARLAVQCRDFQLMDVGESEYLQAMLDFVSLKPSVRAINPALNGKCYFAMINGLVLLLLPLLLAQSYSSKFMELSIVAGILMGAFTTCTLAVVGIGQVLTQSLKHRGIPFALAGLTLAISTACITIHIAFLSA